MTRLVLVEDRPGSFDEFRTEGLAVVPTHDARVGVAIVHLGGSGLLTVDLALPGQAGYRCVTALGGGSADVPILAVLGCDEAPVRILARRQRALRLAHVAGWPSTLGLPPRQFDRLMSILRRCGRFTTQPDRQYLLSVRTVGFFAAAEEPGLYSDAWHAVQFAISRDEARAIA